MTDNNKIQSNSIGDNTIQANLTDKWRKGELSSGWYWVDYYSVDGAVMLEYIPQHNGFGYEEKELVQAVLAPVPSYEQWQQLKEWCEEFNALEVAKENTKLKTENKWYSEQLNEAAKEVAKLKELLTMAREVLKMVDTYSGDYDSINGFLIVEEINQVLGE